MRFEEAIRWVKISNDEQSFLNRVPEQKIYRMTIGKQDVCFTKYGDELFAFENKCPHQFVALTNASCTPDKMVVCPWHRFAFSLENGRGGGLYLPIFPIKRENNSVYIGFKKMVFKLF